MHVFLSSCNKSGNKKYNVATTSTGVAGRGDTRRHPANLALSGVFRSGWAGGYLASSRQIYITWRSWEIVPRKRRNYTACLQRQPGGLRCQDRQKHNFDRGT